MSKATAICCLCGKPATHEDPITREHVPPKQFFPKALRAGLNLWVVPTHRSCNSIHKSDEEYFYLALYPLVANLNPRSAGAIREDLKRRAKQPQTPALLRSILSTARSTSPGGLLLPPGAVRIDADIVRLRRVALKIGRCLFYRDYRRAMPQESCVDLRLCESEEEVPELYQVSWELSKVNVNDNPFPTTPGGIAIVTDLEAGQPLSAGSEVFDYRQAYFEERGLFFYTLRFWEAFVFCMAFQSDVLPGALATQSGR